MKNYQEIIENTKTKQSLLKRLYKYSSPSIFYETANKLTPSLFKAAIILLSIGLFWGLLMTPTEINQGQGHSFRIIYIHVPSAFIAQNAYIAMALAGIIALVWRIKLAKLALRELAIVGFIMSALTIFSGSVWGKPTWGTYWVWDARLTSMFVLLSLYAMVIVATYKFSERNTKIGSYIAVLGIINIPIITYSVNIWSTLHQKSTFKVTAAPTMQAEHWLPLVFCIFGMYSLFLALVLKRTANSVLEKEQKSSWAKELIEKESK